MILTDKHPAAPYAKLIQASSIRHNLTAALVIAVGLEESLWGTAPGYAPHGPEGAGDCALRTRKEPPPELGLRQFYNAETLTLSPPKWPSGAVGFGLGLMQIDAEFHWAWATLDNQWALAERNIDKGAFELKRCMEYFKGNPRAGIAAYNAGARHVDQVVRRGDDPDSITTHGDYAQRVLRAYRALGGTLL